MNIMEHDSNYLLPRVYLNDGNGNLYVELDACFQIFIQRNLALFLMILIVMVILIYLLAAEQFLFIMADIRNLICLMNDGTGKFKDVTDQYAKELSNVGMVTNARCGMI